MYYTLDVLTKQYLFKRLPTPMVKVRSFLEVNVVDAVTRVSWHVSQSHYTCINAYIEPLAFLEKMALS